METHDERLSRLERDNSELRSRVARLEAQLAQHSTGFAALLQQWNTHLSSYNELSLAEIKKNELEAAAARELKAQTLVLRTLAVAALVSVVHSDSRRVFASSQHPISPETQSMFAPSSVDLVHGRLLEIWRQMQGELGAPGVDDETRERSLRLLTHMTSWLGKPLV